MFLRFDISSRWNVKHSTIEHPKCRSLSQTHLSKVAANIAMMLQGYHLIYQCNVAMPLSIRIPYDICTSKEKINEIHIFRTQVSDSKVNHLLPINLSYSSSSWRWSAYDLISWSTARKIGIWIGNRQRRHRHLFFCKISRVTKLGSRQTNNTNGIELDPIHQK